jgi:transcriptional regulator with XRE-family HTH domain
MLLHQKIRLLRLQKGWSQEIMADKLHMSPNGYGSIERGETNIQLSRVNQIAKLFNVEVFELFEDCEQNVFNSMGSHNTEIQNNNNSRCYFNTPDTTRIDCQNHQRELENDIKTKTMLCEQQAKEICLLRQLNDLLQVPKNLS